MTAPVDGIDIHGHGVPRPFLEWVVRRKPAGVDVQRSDGRYVLTFPGARPIRPVTARMLDFGERLQWLDAQDVRQQLVAPWLDVDGQSLPPEAGREWARQLNDSLADAVRDSQGRLRAHVTLHLADPSGAVAELERGVRELGMSGCMIPTDFPGGDLADTAHDTLFEAAEALGVPLVLHPPSAGPSMCVAGMDRFAGLYGRLIDTTMVAARLLVGGLFDRHPGLKMVLVHGGGFLPYQTGRLERHGGRGGNLRDSLTSYVKRFHYDTVLMSPLAIRLLVDLAGAGRVVLGSDYPFVDADQPGITEAIGKAGVTADQARAIRHGNAAELFGIPGG